VEEAVNVENILALADLLETPQVAAHFDMQMYENLTEEGEELARRDGPVAALTASCGTTACIAGWEVARLGRADFGNAYSIAMDSLGLTHSEAGSLFVPGISTTEMSTGHSPYEADGKQAAKVLRHLAETETVDWSVAFADAQVAS
jgi:hypothetical protein